MNMRDSETHEQEYDGLIWLKVSVCKHSIILCRCVIAADQFMAWEGSQKEEKNENNKTQTNVYWGLPDNNELVKEFSLWSYH